MNSPEGCCHGSPWNPCWAPGAALAPVPLLRSLHASPTALAISADFLPLYLNIILVSNAGRDVNRIINPISWFFLPQLLVRQQRRCLLSARGASTEVTKPQKVNELFDRNPGKKGSQRARWSALTAKEVQWPILIAEMPCWSLARLSWRWGAGEGRGLVLEPAAGETPEPSSTLRTPGLHPLLTNPNWECIFYSLYPLRSSTDPCPSGTKWTQNITE